MERPIGRQSPYVIGLLGGLGLLTAYLAFLALRNAASILVLVFVAAFLAVGLNPAVQWLQGRGMQRWLAVTVIGIAGVIIIGAGLVAVVPPLISESTSLINNLPGYIDKLAHHETARRLDEQYHLLERAKSVATPENGGKLLGGLFGGLSLIFSSLFGLLTVALLTVCFLASFERLERGCYRLVPASKRLRVKQLGDQILTKVGWYMLGSLVIAALAGLLSLVFMVIVGIPYPFALAMVVAILDLVPMIGATLAAVLVSVVGFTVSIPVGIATIIFFVVYQQIENWVITPPVMSRAVRITNLSAIVSALVGVALLGVVGALIAIPLWAAIQLVAREVLLPHQDRV
ncbi:putative PurR-regulated permease PerM [Allocatelliglobosispora scoriae]|uniref:Putative PurR-regulated permease PerM n=1 Tax=Allocatelliglobosispora scoriae TaxID=643052 RepID=A0A841BXX4_9ACTN|nr:AI-2E family transporter [Allocatelliglobosispora scoriae]MBB5872515.1 putative PurR-regulated permease PerM [Allocatelliglobosispora scoriae]